MGFKTLNQHHLPNTVSAGGELKFTDQALRGAGEEEGTGEGEKGTGGDERQSNAEGGCNCQSVRRTQGWGDRMPGSEPMGVTLKIKCIILTNTSFLFMAETLFAFLFHGLCLVCTITE